MTDMTLEEMKEKIGDVLYNCNVEDEGGSTRFSDALDEIVEYALEYANDKSDEAWQRGLTARQD